MWTPALTWASPAAAIVAAIGNLAFRRSAPTLIAA